MNKTEQSSSLRGVYTPTGEADSQLHTHARRLLSDKEKNNARPESEADVETGLGINNLMAERAHKVKV